MMRARPPDRISAAKPATSTRPLSSQVQNPYPAAKTKNRPHKTQKSRASTRIRRSSVLGLGGPLGRRPLLPLGVDRMGGGGQRLLPDRGEGLGLPVGVVVAEGGGRVEVARVVRRRDDPHLEVHLRVVVTAELGAAAPVGPEHLRPELELVVLVLGGDRED